MGASGLGILGKRNQTRFESFQNGETSNLAREGRLLRYSHARRSKPFGPDKSIIETTFTAAIQSIKGIDTMRSFPSDQTLLVRCGKETNKHQMFSTDSDKNLNC